MKKILILVLSILSIGCSSKKEEPQPQLKLSNERVFINEIYWNDGNDHQIIKLILREDGTAERRGGKVNDQNIFYRDFTGTYEIEGNEVLLFMSGDESNYYTHTSGGCYSLEYSNHKEDVFTEDLTRWEERDTDVKSFFKNQNFCD
ncbi:hypothetical protein MY04_3325 [Flammeovirga sp. MY04]|uniref:hypothetical protein n=1 Tax=Flammeovirga sp. MY04 TaxID=1191459 RepID=UPI00080643F6|nr:hypothetical protein [Flammeovirga sp. MY04]ANQ50687.1 hypothetical protein MY04_3325 [Flammeovirga sp. MY04]